MWGAAGSEAAGGAAGFDVDAAGGGVSLGGTQQTSLPPADAGACAPVSCGASPRQCGNCLDDDADGVVDANDPECLGPCDDSEAALFSGTATRVNGSCRADCYFDRNAGSGDDGCSWSMSCDPLAVAPDYSPTGLESYSYDPTNARCEMRVAEQSACRAGCLPLTPTGCDCFGCCELPAGSGSFKWLGSENLEQGHCELSSSSDPAACRPCTPAPDCQNPCDECELCVGKPALSEAQHVRAADPGGYRGSDPGSPLRGRLHARLTTARSQRAFARPAATQNPGAPLFGARRLAGPGAVSGCRSRAAGAALEPSAVDAGGARADHGHSTPAAPVTPRHTHHDPGEHTRAAARAARAAERGLSVSRGLLPQAQLPYRAVKR